MERQVRQVMRAGMTRYVVRRVAYMLPTVLGVIVITFVLFNIAGGDPAQRKFGQQATATAMEDFDIVRGYDKPLFMGMWGRTRAYSRYHETFKTGIGPWSTTPGAVATNGNLMFAEAGEKSVPIEFTPCAADYRWCVKWRNESDESGLLLVSLASGEVAQLELKPGGWQNGEIRFAIGTNDTDLAAVIDVPDGVLELAELKLQRRTHHIFDSQFVFFITRLAHFDLGKSHETNQPVSRMILEGLLPSLSLTVPIFIVSVLVSISLALICAFYRDTAVDRLFVVMSVALMSVHYLVWIVLGQYIFAFKLGLFPVWGYESPAYLILPCIIGVVSGLGANLRFYRTVMLDEMYRDYVRTAFAKGVGKTGVLFKHVLKNAMIPILTSVVMAIPFLYTGSMLLESFFGIPGLGRMGVNGLMNSDADVVRALVFVGAMIYVVASLITDILYAAVDPRIKLK